MRQAHVWLIVELSDIWASCWYHETDHEGLKEWHSMHMQTH